MVNTRKRMYEIEETKVKAVNKPGNKKLKLENISTKLKHPEGWNHQLHYGQCGQSCPCCRAIIEDYPLGVCPICWDILEK